MTSAHGLRSHITVRHPLRKQFIFVLERTQTLIHNCATYFSSIPCVGAVHSDNDRFNRSVSLSLPPSDIVLRWCNVLVFSLLTSPSLQLVNLGGVMTFNASPSPRSNRSFHCVKVRLSHRRRSSRWDTPSLDVGISSENSSSSFSSFKLPDSGMWDTSSLVTFLLFLVNLLILETETSVFIVVVFFFNQPLQKGGRQHFSEVSHESLNGFS